MIIKIQQSHNVADSSSAGKEYIHIYKMCRYRYTRNVVNISHTKGDRVKIKKNI